MKSPLTEKQKRCSVNFSNTREPRIAIDALGIIEVGGARSVTLPLLQRVFQQKSDWHFYCFLTKKEEMLDFPNVKQIILPLSKGLLSRLAFQFIIPFYVLLHKINVTHFIKSQGSILFSSKKVLTIYDCTILKYPDYFSLPSRLFWRYIQPVMSRYMDHIITISNDAKMEINQYLHISPEKIAVIYPAPQFESVGQIVDSDEERTKRIYNIEQDYLLYIGQIGMKKNLMTLIKAYNVLQNSEVAPPPLLMAGPRYYLSDAGEIFSAIEALGLQDQIRYLGAVEKGELEVILKNAMMLLFPSIHEGFGIPIAEAMQLGVPVISSNTSVMPEVLDGAGALVDDFLSPEAWSEKIKELIQHPEIRQTLSLKGLERSKTFSWDTSANQLIQIYEDLLKPDDKDY